MVKELSGAQVMALADDVPALEAMKPGGEVHPIDRVLPDGEAVTLGGTTLVAHLTPGHTLGCTTWTMVHCSERRELTRLAIGVSRRETSHGERIAKSQRSEHGEVAVGAPDLANVMTQAQGGYPGVVNPGAGHTRRQDDLVEDFRVVVVLGQHHQRRRLEPGIHLPNGGEFQRCGCAEDPGMRDNRQETRAGTARESPIRGPIQRAPPRRSAHEHASRIPRGARTPECWCRRRSRAALRVGEIPNRRPVLQRSTRLEPIAAERGLAQRESGSALPFGHDGSQALLNECLDRRAILQRDTLRLPQQAVWQLDRRLHTPQCLMRPIYIGCMVRARPREACVGVRMPSSEARASTGWEQR